MFQTPTAVRVVCVGGALVVLAAIVGVMLLTTVKTPAGTSCGSVVSPTRFAEVTGRYRDVEDMIEQDTADRNRSACDDVRHDRTVKAGAVLVIGLAVIGVTATVEWLGSLRKAAMAVEERVDSTA